MTIIIFTGPTLSSAEGREILDATFRPPVACGDLYREALAGPKAIGIIDGYFQNVAAVWHKEILWALSQGIQVFGGASMGALRAAELAPFGMTGLGRIFEGYRDGLLEDDDEVAVIHGPPELDFRPLSEALVNIRCSLTAAARDHAISGATCKALLDIGKALFYRDRTYQRILEIGLDQGCAAEEVEALRRWLDQGAIDQKRDDALGMLRAIAAWAETGPSPKRIARRFEVTDAWRALTREVGNA